MKIGRLDSTSQSIAMDNCDGGAVTANEVVKSVLDDFWTDNVILMGNA
ncbi:hypothetical protein [Emergencia timonensis]|nr:hypothetical protein [Emergencia timonensis]